MTKVTINVSLTSGHSEGELYFLEGEGGKTVGIEHRFTFLPPRFGFATEQLPISGKVGQCCTGARLFTGLSQSPRAQGRTSSSGSGERVKKIFYLLV